jgi:D-glycerate 3-kinase
MIILDTILDNFIKEEHLSGDYRERAALYFVPLARQIMRWKKDDALCVGINGAQGSGKSTLARFIKRYLEQQEGWSVAIISLDDLYLTQAERQGLAAQIHPLLSTRGVPGTHDIDAGVAFMQACLGGHWAQAICPRFEKERDDRAPRETWLSLDKAPDLILFEGWCVGAQAEPAAALVEPINQLEREEDPQGIWRNYVNRMLAEVYPRLFAYFSHWIVLQPHTFESVQQNRLLQERKLRERMNEHGTDAKGLMDDVQVVRFVAHYERLTRWMWHEFPQRAHVTLHLSDNHAIDRVVHA